MYLSKLSEDVLDLLDEDMMNHGVTVAGGDVVTICTNLFVSVLDDSAKGVNTSIDKIQSLYEKIDLIGQKDVYVQARKLFYRIKRNNQIAHQLREIFELDDRGYHIEEFLDPHPCSTSFNLDKDPENDVYSLLQTIYENCLYTETYDEAMVLFKAMNDYIEMAVYDVSSSSPDELAARRKEIITLLSELYGIDNE